MSPRSTASTTNTDTCGMVSMSTASRLASAQHDPLAPTAAAGSAQEARPRIACFFSTSGHSGVDRAAGHLLPALARRGYRVDQLKVRRHGPELTRLPDGLEVLDLGSAHTYGCVPALVRYLRTHRPLVLLSDKDRVNRTALLAKTLARTDTRLVFRSGTTVSVDLKYRGWLERGLQRSSMRHLYPKAARVIVPSEGAADDLAAYTGLARDHVVAVPSPIVHRALLSEVPPPPDHAWFQPHRPPLILGVGELGARKDFATLLRAFALLRAGRACRLMILGRGAQRDELLALARELGVAQAVSLPGFVPEPYAYMAHADVLASSSLWEGLPFVPVEALAVGTPVVSTDCPSGPREILQGGRYGELVPIGDAQAMADALARTLDDPLPANELREAAARFEIEAATDAYLDAMELARYATPSDTDAVGGRP